MDALKTLCAKLGLGWVLIAPRQGALLKAIEPGSSDREAGYVIVAQNLIFPQFADTVDREGLFNEVVMTYEETVPDTYGQDRVQQKRVLAQYVDAGEDLACTGPFGFATRESVALDVPEGTADPTQYAKDLALETMGGSFSYSRMITLQCGPIYGLEQGDGVYVQVEGSGVRKLATLVGATIPLRADGGPWQLDLMMVEPLDAAWTPRYTVTTETVEYADNFTWSNLRPKTTVDLDKGKGSGKTKKLWRGWTVDNDSKLVGGPTLTATSDGGQVIFHTTDRAWSESATEHRYQARASVTAAKGSMKVRIGLDTNTQGVIWGDWKSYTTGKTQTVKVDTEREVSAASVSFGIRIETTGMVSGDQVRINSASVDRAIRNKT
jgi:hypothetical protein